MKITSCKLGLVRLVLLCTATLLLPSMASAQAPDCPSDSVLTYSGTMTATGTVPFDVGLAPCQTVAFSVTTTGDSMYGASVYFTINNSETSPRSLWVSNWAAYGTVSQTLPDAYWMYPYPGTRGVQGLMGSGSLYASFYSGLQLTYSITATKTRRPDYNIGGVSFDSAPLISTGETLYGSVHEWEPGQFYKIHLEAGQLLYLTGQLTGSSMYGTG